jgi:hypothetical protein
MKEYELRLQIGKVRANKPLYRLRQIIPPKAHHLIPKVTVRTVHLQGAVVRFPTHPPLRTRTTKDVTRWIRQDAVWTLWEQSG